LLRGGTILEGATVEGCYRFVDVPLASFVSFPCVGHVCAVAPAFFFCLLELLYDVVALFIKRGQGGDWIISCTAALVAIIVLVVGLLAAEALT
jgi:hypothetical protein